ncbi:hypothetical protein TEA_009614 [Camellia sinensis var. sinensis]|uniref:PCI domain-containing protein n=1 Tax=Camellia sinensis var. sinensis TaxID=542762 RepID=A0A4S4DXQ0_CAMSN|nr:hypothetical protein TEA_009614 [Camellia sinensis var. sinensis]
MEDAEDAEGLSEWEQIQSPWHPTSPTTTTTSSAASGSPTTTHSIGFDGGSVAVITDNNYLHNSCSIFPPTEPTTRACQYLHSTTTNHRHKHPVRRRWKEGMRWRLWLRRGFWSFLCVAGVLGVSFLYGKVWRWRRRFRRENEERLMLLVREKDEESYKYETFAGSSFSFISREKLVSIGRHAFSFNGNYSIAFLKRLKIGSTTNGFPPGEYKEVIMSSSYVPATTESLDQAQEAKNPTEAISILYRILENPSSSSEALRIKEKAISNLSDLLREQNRAEELRSLLTQLRPFFSLIPKAKTAKIVRGIIDAVAKIPGTSDLQISLCKEMVQWTRAEKRTFLRQRVEARLAALLMESKEYSEALALLSVLIKEVRRLDDKLLLVDIELLESKLHFSLRNLPKAKAALTAARTAANAIYVPPDQQGTIDLQSGILHAEEKDYKTAYSYFYEAFEAFNALEDPRAIYSLKYMLLCKIMVNQADDVAGILSSAKVGLQYQGPEVDAMKAVAHAHAQRSLKLFETALRDFKAQLEEDPIVHRHLSSLYDTLLEQNLCRLIEPFSRVEIAHIAELIELPVEHVEKKLSQMILDKKFAGTLDQGAGCLIIFEDPKPDAIYPATLETISNIGKVVDSLYVRSAKIMA